MDGPRFARTWQRDDLVAHPRGRAHRGVASVAWTLGRDMAASGGWCAADHLLQPLRVLLAAAGEGVDNDGQQHNQQLAQEDV